MFKFWHLFITITKTAYKRKLKISYVFFDTRFYFLNTELHWLHPRSRNGSCARGGTAPVQPLRSAHYRRGPKGEALLQLRDGQSHTELRQMVQGWPRVFQVSPPNGCGRRANKNGPSQTRTPKPHPIKIFFGIQFEIIKCRQGAPEIGSCEMCRRIHADFMAQIENVMKLQHCPQQSKVPPAPKNKTK